MNRKMLLDNLLSLFADVLYLFGICGLGILLGAANISIANGQADMNGELLWPAFIILLLAILLVLFIQLLFRFFLALYHAFRHHAPLKNMPDDQRLCDISRSLFDDLSLENKRLAIDFFGNLLDEQKKDE
jgi:site-specific recombinase